MEEVTTRAIAILEIFLLACLSHSVFPSNALPQQILLDSDIDTDDLFAILYLLKHNQSEINLKAITINANTWTDAGHAINHVYDMLYMMGRDDIPVGIGGEGGILYDGTILPNVGGYLPLIEQELSTTGGCRYRQAIPPGFGGRLDTNSNYGIRKGFLPQVFHSGLPVTLVPLDATNTIPINEKFFSAFEQNQHTYEAQYCFESLKITRDTWFDSEFYTSYFMWDSFTSGVVISSIRNGHANINDNEFAELKYRNITVVTSNKPYGIQDGSNILFDNRTVPKFHLRRGGVHSGHVQTGLQDPFCLVPNAKGKCQDGYTREVSGTEGVRVSVAKKAKPNRDNNSTLDREFFKNFLHVLNNPHQTAQFNLKTQFLYYKEVLYKPNFKGQLLGRTVIFDMDMSPGDFVSLFYLLKMPVELINLKGITVNANGWANAATIDIIYDVLHMMGRDDISVGLGDFFALGQAYPSFSAVGDCKYSKAIPYGAGGFIDCDTLFGSARSLPRSPRRYTAHNSLKFGAPRNTDHPELRQPRAKEVWQNVSSELKEGSKVTILATGPLTNIAHFLSFDANSSSKIEHLYIVGGHIDQSKNPQQGNVHTVPSNKNAEFNMFLDPLAAKHVIASKLNITLVPLNIRRKVSSFAKLVEELEMSKETPEAVFVHRLLSMMQHLHRSRPMYSHIDTFLGEVLGAAIMMNGPQLRSITKVKPIGVVATGDVATDGWTFVDHKNGNPVHVVEDIDVFGYYSHIATMLNEKAQSAVIASFAEQKRLWNTPTGKPIDPPPPL
eukprot:Gb_08959 [translate_table: standard]